MATHWLRTWCKRVFFSGACSPPARRRRARPLRLERLEDRLVPAIFKENGNVLNIFLNRTGGENVAIASYADVTEDGTYAFVLNQGDTWSGANDNNRVTGSGLATLTVTAGVFYGGINISDIAAGESVSFLDSSNNRVGDINGPECQYFEAFTVELTHAGAGSITFNGGSIFHRELHNSGGGSLTAVTTGSITVASGASVDAISASLTAANNLTVASNASVSGFGLGLSAGVNPDGSGNSSGTLAIQSGATVSSKEYAITVRGAALSIDTSANPATISVGPFVPNFAGVVIRTAQPSQTMNVGGTNPIGANINLSSAELARIGTPAAFGVAITFGDSNQTGTITFQDATPATTAGASTVALESPTGPGQIVLDNSAGTALNGNGGDILLQAGTGGIVEKGSNVSGTADLGTTGPGIGLDTTGPIGSSGQPLLIADDSNTAQQVVSIGSLYQPSAAYLAGLGSLTLGNVSGPAANTSLNVTAATNLTVAGNSILDVGTGTLALSAGVNPDGSGNSNGTLTIPAGATVVSSNANSNAITLRGAAVSIDTSADPALIGARRIIANLTGLNVPSALAFDSQGNLFVANQGNGTVSEFAPGSTTATATLTGLNYPQALAFDSQGNLFVANEGGGLGKTVSEFAPGSTTATAILTGLNVPQALAFDSQGNLFVANEGGGLGKTVSEFAPGSTTPTATLTGLNGPLALAFDSHGNLFVANVFSSTVSEFAPGSTTPSTTLTGLNGPLALAFDSHGNLFVTNADNDTVSEFAPGSTTPTATLTGLNVPFALACDASGNLFVANLGSPSDPGTVSEFAPGSTTPTATLPGLRGPDALAFDSHGNLFVANGRGTTVSEFAATGVVPAAGGVVIRTAQPGQTMNIGGTTPTGANINLSSAALGQIYTAGAGTLTIGSTNAGTLTVTGAVDLTHVNTLSLVTGSSFDQQTGGLLEVSNLALSAQSGIGASSPLATQVTDLAFQNATGDVSITNTGGMTLGAVATLTSSSNTGGSTTLEALQGSLTVAGDLTSAGDLSVTTTENPSESSANPEEDVNFNSNVTVESTGGTITVNAADSLLESSGALIKSDQAGVYLNYGVGDTDNDATISLHGSVVPPLTPTITVNLVNITYGTALANSQLSSDTASVPGTFSYDASVLGTVLNASSTAYQESVTFTPTDTTHYNKVTMNVAVTVSQATLTITPDANQSKLYGAQVPSNLTYTPKGLVNGDTAASVLSGQLGTQATASSDVGTYAFTLGTLAISGGNYSLVLDPNASTFAVTQATLIITANNATKIQGEANPPFSVSYSGFVLSQDPSVLGGTLTFNTTATKTSLPGLYDINPSGLTSGNYAIQYQKGTLTVISYSTATSTYVQALVDSPSSHLASGIKSSLDAQLQAAIAYFQAQDTTDAVSVLRAFISHVSALTSKQIDATLAKKLIAAAQRIINAVG